MSNLVDVLINTRDALALCYVGAGVCTVEETAAKEALENVSAFLDSMQGNWRLVPEVMTNTMEQVVFVEMGSPSDWCGFENAYKAMLAAAPKPEEPVQRLTVENAPVGTLAPAIMGGRWYRTELGWKWNGPDGSGGTFPRPGGDWNGVLVAPKPEDAT